MSEEKEQPNGWGKKTIIQRAISVGESKVTATSILSMIDDKYKPRLQAAANPKEFAKQWGLLRTKALTPTKQGEPESTPEDATLLDEQTENHDSSQVAE